MLTRLLLANLVWCTRAHLPQTYLRDISLLVTHCLKCSGLYIQVRDFCRLEVFPCFSLVCYLSVTWLDAVVRRDCSCVVSMRFSYCLFSLVVGADMVSSAYVNNSVCPRKHLCCFCLKLSSGGHKSYCSLYSREAFE